MAGKLTFRYAAMNAGKSMNIITTAFNYEELGLKPLILISDEINREYVKTRAGLEAKAYKFSKLVKKEINYKIYDVILVDEVQFLSKEEVRLLYNLSCKGIDIICYGLRTDFKGELFEGSKYLLAWADKLEEMSTLCYRCKKKARMNARFVNGIQVTEGNQIVIDGINDIVEYKSACRKHFIK